MTLRWYTVIVERVERQEVGFFAEPHDDAMLTRIAVAHCQDDCWTETEYRRAGLTSQPMRVETAGEVEVES